jgi:predicted TIM-barrel fold metal-dependent hydrolase
LAIVDSHAHVVAGDLMTFPPAQPDDPGVQAVLARPFPAESLLRNMDETGVRQALLVQRGQIYRFDNSYICEAARESGGRLHAVCAIDARREDCADQARAWADRGAVGFRVMAYNGEQNTDWFTGENAKGLWRQCADLGLPLCVHLFPNLRTAGLEALALLLGEFPAVSVVLDHLGNPGSVSAADPGLDAAITRLADRRNLYLKFTTIPLGQLDNEGEDTSAVLDAYISTFGAARLMWGSDVTQSPGDYGHMVNLARKATAGVGEAQALMLGEVARTVYGLA